MLAAILIAVVVDHIFFRSNTRAGIGLGVAGQAVIVHAGTNLLMRATTRVQSGSLVIGTSPGALTAKTRYSWR